MVKNIKVVDIGQDTSNKNEEGETREEVAAEVVEKVDDAKEVADEVEEEVVLEAIEPETSKVDDKPKSDKKMITCPDCGKYMLERNFRSKHIRICGKPKVSKAKPIEEVIKEKREKAVASSPPKAEPKPKPVVVEQTAPPPPLPPPAKPDYLALRREYANHLKERKQELVKKLISKAF